MNTKLEQLLELPNVWQASRVRRLKSVLATGYSELDAQLHDSGWPDNATTELLLPQPGIGELRLVLPGLRQAQRLRPWLAFIAPPHLPYAAALIQHSINPEGVLVVTPQSPKDLLWAAEQCLQSGCCGAVLTWAMGTELSTQQLRRLQQAAHQGQCWHTLFRATRAQRQPSPSALRIQLNPGAQGLLQVDILKQRGGWSGQSLAITLQPDLSQLQKLNPEQLPLPMAQFNRPLPPVDSPNEGTLNSRVVPLSRRRG
ncbi:translesion DNA synthesis-associated protein ImuA [Gilvimarinus sp. F26214L]|uniref:translesion DNA synthesis-associated protein ImuA n=1 Tax=Gilvimarinus sp. DZF01 TaxID=3461371 RepID=UPI004046482C